MKLISLAKFPQQNICDQDQSHWVLKIGLGVELENLAIDYFVLSDLLNSLKHNDRILFVAALRRQFCHEVNFTAKLFVNPQ